MDFSARIALVVGVFSLTYMLNIPMGFLRAKTKKLSLNWFLCVHATIPVIYMGRLMSGLDYRYIPIFVVAAVFGQIWGGKLELS